MLKNKPIKRKSSQVSAKRGLTRPSGLFKPLGAKSTPYTKAKKKTKADVYRDFCLPEFMIRSGGLKSGCATLTPTEACTGTGSPVMYEKKNGKSGVVFALRA